MTPNPYADKIKAAEACFQNGNVNEALGIFDDILQKDPDNTEALNNKGVIMNLNGNHTAAESIFLSLIGKNHITRDVIYNLAANYLVTQNWEKAQEAIETYGSCLSKEDLISIGNDIEKAVAANSLPETPTIPLDPMYNLQHEQENLNRIFTKTLFFIVGCPKSGTTWLQNTLNGHPDVRCAGESNINMLRRQLGTLKETYNADILKINNTYIKDGNPYSVLSEKNLDFLFASLVSILFDNLSTRADVQCLGMKNPDHLANMEFTARLFPGMKYIHIIRDGRDVAVSGWFHNLRTEKETFQQMYPDFGDYIENIAIAWTEAVRKARKFGKSNPQSYLELRYEDLHRTPDIIIEKILRFLNIDASGPLVGCCRESGAFENLSKGRKPGQEDRGSFFRKGIAGDWRNHFQSHHLAVFHHHARDLLQELGYE